jgi:L-rhamnose-H+ transport protein
MMVFALGGLAGATFLIPARGVKDWAYETWWMFYCVVGLLVCPPVICAFTVPDFWNVTTSASTSTLLQCAGFGALWGIGGLTWGLMVRYLGIGLGLAIGCGLCAATGTLIPPIATGHAADLVKDTGAIIVLVGVIGSLAGIGFVGYAGKLKEGELPEEEKKKAVAEFDFKKGMVVALVSGVCSACMNFGLQSGGSIEKAAYAAAVKAGVVAEGAPWSWQGMPVIMVVLWGGFVVQAAWVLQQHFKNGTFGDYVKPEHRGENWVLASLVGVIWVFQFVCQKAGEPLMGDLKYISFAIVMASTILFSTLAGILFGEWKGVGARTKVFLALGTAVLLVSFVVISLGAK